MKRIEIKDDVIEILKEKKNGFQIYRTAYHIVERLKKKNPTLFKKMCDSYGAKYGKGAEVHYAMTNFVALACKYFQKSDKCFKLAWIDTTGVKFFEKQPGWTGNFVSIWTYKIMDTGDCGN